MEGAVEDIPHPDLYQRGARGVAAVSGVSEANGVNKGAPAKPEVIAPASYSDQQTGRWTGDRPTYPLI